MNEAKNTKSVETQKSPVTGQKADCKVGSHVVMSVDNPQPLSLDTTYRNAVTVYALLGNTGNIFVGNQESQPMPLAKGDSVTIRRTSLNLVWVYGDTTADKAVWICGGA